MEKLEINLKNLLIVKKITFENAEDLSMRTDYAIQANECTEEINQGDAAAFFLEGYNHAIRMFYKNNEKLIIETKEITNQQILNSLKNEK